MKCRGYVLTEVTLMYFIAFGWSVILVSIRGPTCVAAIPFVLCSSLILRGRDSRRIANTTHSTEEQRYEITNIIAINSSYRCDKRLMIKDRTSYRSENRNYCRTTNWSEKWRTSILVVSENYSGKEVSREIKSTWAVNDCGKWRKPQNASPREFDYFEMSGLGRKNQWISSSNFFCSPLMALPTKSSESDDPSAET